MPENKCAWVGIPEAAREFGVHTKTIRAMIAAGELPAYRIGGRDVIRIKRADLDALLIPVPTAEVR